MNILFITDSLHSVNGMSIFSRLFVHFLSNTKFQYNVYLFELETRSYYENDNNDNLSLISFVDDIDRVYINGHFTKADIFFRKNPTFFFESILCISCTNVTVIKISHGWQKMRPFFSLYYLYYFFRHFHKTLFISSAFKYYNEVLFISNNSDLYRHFDFSYCVKHNLNYSFFDFQYFFEFYSSKPKLFFDPITNSSFIKSNFLLVIANCDPVKNLLSLILINYKFFIIPKPRKRQIVLLTSSSVGFYGKFILFVLNKFNITIITDQSQKSSLLYNCDYLFIASFTEYLPIVSLEASSYAKRIISIFKISSLKDNLNYHSIFK